MTPIRDVLAIVISLIVAIAAAAVMWGWWRSPIPTFLVFSSGLHGMMLGVGLMWIIDRLAIRSRIRRAFIGIVAGVVSLLVLTVGQYVTDAYDYHLKTQHAMAVMLGAPAPEMNPIAAYDRNVLEPVTGRRGMIGYLQFRDAEGWRRQLRALESILMVGVATTLSLTAGGGRAATVD